jgi:hypothetical protein
MYTHYRLISTTDSFQTDALDTKNFDEEFTKEAPTDSYVDGPMLSSTAQAPFFGFSYNRLVTSNKALPIPTRSVRISLSRENNISFLLEHSSLENY